MPNPLRGEIRLGDAVLRFTINSICEFEAETGRKFIEVANEMQGAPSVLTLRDLVWAGLRHAQPEVTRAQAGDLMEAVGLKAVSDALGEAMRAAFPDAAEGTPEKN